MKNDDKRVDGYVLPVYESLRKNNIEGQARIDIYNRSYEAVYNAINDNSIDLDSELAILLSRHVHDRCGDNVPHDIGLTLLELIKNYKKGE